MPSYKDIDSGIVDFQKIKTISLPEFLLLTRLATISESFFKNIQAQFANYYARPGQPDLDKDGIISKHVNQHFPE
jgi:hypothetical protein